MTCIFDVAVVTQKGATMSDAKLVTDKDGNLYVQFTYRQSEVDKVMARHRIRKLLEGGDE